MKNIFLLLIVTIALLSSSCNTPRYVYGASPVNNPYFTEKGDAKLTGYYSGGESAGGGLNHGVDVSAAYAFADGWAITGAYYNRREEDVFNADDFFDSSTVSYKRNLWEAGIGFFQPLNTKKTITFNMYAGYANGKFSIDDKGTDLVSGSGTVPYTRFHDAKINKWYIQPSINFMPSKYFHLSLAGRLSFVHYGKVSTSYTKPELANYYLNKIDGKTSIYFEPCLNMQAGLPKVNWAFVDFCLSGATRKVGEYPSVRGLNLSIGLTFKLSGKRTFSDVK